MTDRHRHLSAQPTHTTNSSFQLDDPADAKNETAAMKALPPVIVADGATVEIKGNGTQLATFAGTTGTLVLDDAVAFRGQISGLTGSDALDLADVKYGSTTTATFSGNAGGGTLTVSNGSQTANIALVGDYLHSGWTLSSDGHGGTVVVDPPLAGTVYANATNTGVQPGTNLKPAPSNDYTITTPGVYSGLTFTGAVTIDCSNVTLENCHVEMKSSDWIGVYVAGGLSNVVVQNCEVAGAGANSTQVGASGISVFGDSQVSIYNNNIHDVGNGFGVAGGQVVIENNYVHNFAAAPGTHINGMETNGGEGADFSLLMKDNSIINNAGQCDAIMIDNSIGSVSNITVTNNLLVGGDYAVYVDGHFTSAPITNINISNNHLGTGIYGYWDLNQGSLSNANYQVNTSGNVDDGATLAALASVGKSSTGVSVGTSSTGASVGTSSTGASVGTSSAKGSGTLQVKAATAPTKVIQTDGSTSLTEVANRYYLYRGSGSGPALKYKGANVTAGEFGSWTPIGAVQTARGYDVAWKNTSTGRYMVWTTDGNGNYKGNIGAVSGTSSALEKLEPVFRQDLNRDGVIGLATRKVIQTDGSTSLTEVANRYYLYGGSGSGPALKYKGANVTAGEFGSWTPIGAVQTARGYDVAWKNTSTGRYTVWTTDGNGNYKGNIGAVSGTSSALEKLEPVFRQDLNRDGVIGLATRKVIQTDGSTSLTEVANRYYLYGGSGSGPALKYKGANVTAGEFGSWTPIGAVQTARGYDVAWKNTSTGRYTVWTTDGNGNYKGNIGAVSGTSSALEKLEPVFRQDLNRDGVIGLYAAPGMKLQIGNALTSTTGSATIGRGATLELAAADSAAVKFTSSTGTLRIDHPSTFTGKIFNFSGDGSFSGSDHIDIRNIKYGPIKDNYHNGTLTVTDSSGHEARLSFSGSYSLGNFKFASDGNGGTIVYDPPVSQSSSKYTDASTGPSQKAPVGADVALHLAGLSSRDTLAATLLVPQTTLGSLSEDNNRQGAGTSPVCGRYGANVALLGQFMATTFAPAGDNHGSTMALAEAVQPSDQSPLTTPHHA